MKLKNVRRMKILLLIEKSQENLMFFYDREVQFVHRHT